MNSEYQYEEVKNDDLEKPLLAQTEAEDDEYVSRMKEAKTEQTYGK